MPALTLRCQWKGGSHVLTTAEATTTLTELRGLLVSLCSIHPDNQKILSGYPPKELVDPSGGGASTLAELGIKSGETLRIEPSNAAPASASQPQPTPQQNAKTGQALSGLSGLPGSSAKAGLEAQSRARKLVRRVVPADNSCLFNSIWYAMIDRQLQPVQGANELRQAVAEAVRADPITFDEATLGMARDKYIAWILDREHWGGGIEISILCKHFATEMDVVDTQTLRIDRFGEADGYSNRIFLIFDGIHYDILAEPCGPSESPDRDITVFPVSDQGAEQRALAVAKEANQKRQFTNLAGFTIRCLACQTPLVGQREAQAHAMSTGHTNFGEV
ncbi:ubiquitin thioesterase OTU1 [Capsaspora owczarzaki ATCC 30864]|uniref:Ubiquitin thioesterase OTU n=1 Tax=Capsaspora owczarzaki (strain ATCC 30864) TaxID=595528 RepID=A0A0D2UQS6_CAPO3|nr:ubiquitin thioesterase OTU1 [Capsaspora owczarzaki ATCC 30864]KJE97376.1 ubiquitin thioesterase OTU1 [Capsaspora owczarzaki ATCC 30864]|eukprot:XP_004343106.1 ubiquitin thioesterase OTU1 [Capsaspora owczarzaki ATCC 30864]